MMVCGKHGESLVAERECPWCQIVRLRAEVAALKKDADRYRWLRSSFRVARWDVKYWTGEFWDVMYGDAMDKQIDAALKEKL